MSFESSLVSRTIFRESKRKMSYATKIPKSQFIIGKRQTPSHAQPPSYQEPMRASQNTRSSSFRNANVGPINARNQNQERKQPPKHGLPGLPRPLSNVPQPRKYQLPLPMDPSANRNSLDKPKNITIKEHGRSYPDSWAIVLYALSLLVFVVMAILGIPQLKLQLGGNSIQIFGKLIPTASVVASAGLAFTESIILSSLYYLGMRHFPGVMIHLSFVLKILIDIGFCVLFIHAIPLAVGFGLLALITLIWYITVRHRIPFARVILKTVANMIRMYPATIFTSFVSATVSGLFLVFYIVTLFGCVVFFNSSSQAGMNALMIFLSLVLLWTTQILNNVVHVTVSGLFATVLFMGVANPATNKIDVFVKHPTWRSAKRALTTSFGPIAFGSLVVAIIQLIKSSARNASNRNGNGGNAGLSIFCCILYCLFSCLEEIVQYFNTYAFVQVAIYGKSFVEAGKATWELFKARGFDMIINDSIIETVLNLAGFSIAIICSVTCFFMGGVFADPLERFPSMLISAIVGVIIGGFIFQSMAAVIHSGVTATFVCLAEDPATVARNQPGFFAKVQKTYPGVNWGARSCVEV